MKFKVIDPKGVSIAGVVKKQGEIVEGEPKTAAISTPLHFKQIEPVSEAATEAGEDEDPPEIEISDAARKLASENGIDITTVKGTGKDGAIVKSDIEAAIEAGE